MADTKISALTVATTPLAGTEVLPIVQSGVTKQVSVANLTAGRAVSADSLTLTGSPLPATSGGTGQSSYAVGDLLYASTTTALSKLADVATGNALISGGVGVAPSWGKIGLTTHVSGTLAVGNGGTGLTSYTSTGIIYASGTTTLASGSALTFDGTNFATTGNASAKAFIPTSNVVPTNGLYLQGTNTIGIATNGTNAFTIDASQNAGFGNYGYAKLTVVNDIALINSNSAKKISWWSQANGDSENARIEVNNNGATTNTGVIKFYTKDGTTLTQRGQIDEVGNWLLNTTDSSLTTGVGAKFITSTTTPWMGFVWNTAGGGSNYHLYNTNATNNGYRFYVSVNGGISNYSANNVNLASDYRLKHDIEPVKSYWNVFKSIGWKTWIYNDQSDDIKNIGVIAQELQALAPELVCESKLKETPEGELPYLGIWENDFKMAAMSVITELVKKSEEQQILIEQLVAKIEGKV